ncbi:nucleoside triphosphate pyrophosphohydrolase [Aureispira anguillae]|uniref:Nucleoside triphosphate pyrophosphohydrolase n=1 Tax=Aureispira anguillae TaxID=2864201 RepID=A0A915YBG3_9BACT|nr:nucleoside triphosphate pyrophosphohydrolase [Aureispira anguillae]BDS10012.1 nucleoside triphosphate pyrophosphohydrolase [Aureispira anguillae]
MEEKIKAFERLLNIMDDLREKCPWDKKQTLESLSILTIEETYELVDAIQEGNLEELKGEIGDLMLHMVFYAKIASEKKAFDIADVLNTLCDKLVHRHPHIYGDVVAEDEATVKKNWELLKLQEKGKTSILQGVPKSLPSMVKAYRIQEKVKQVGFEWEEIEDVWDKVEEELGELQITVDDRESSERIADEFGDVLFALINYARYLKIDPEAALEKTNKKFIRRFKFIEDNANRALADLSLEEMDELWDKAKRLEQNK